jgi:DNA-binding CsgD family transcriptional regulator
MLESPPANALRCPRCGSTRLHLNLDHDLECLCGAVLYNAPSGPVEPAQPPGAPATVLLTDRQLELLHWVAMGAPNRLIALNLGIGMGTLKSHIRNIRDRLALGQGRDELQAVARQLEEA